MRFSRLVCSLLLGLSTLAWPQTAHPQPAPSITPYQQQRLILFTRLAGSVRYFYPNRHTSQADWNAFYIRYLPALLQAPTPQAVTDTLRHAFATIAPGVVLQEGPRSPPPPRRAPATAQLAYRWEHRSLTLEQKGLGLVPVMMRLAHVPFASRLVVDTLSARTLPATYTLPLSDSLSASIPLVLPRAQARAPIAFHQRVRRFQVAQPAHRLALIMQTWNVLQHFYPYRLQLTQADWPAALRTGLLAADAAQSKAAVRVACQEMVAQLGDRHVQVAERTRTGLYLTPPDFALGFELLADGRTVVARSQGQWAARLPLGSTLEQVNGQPIAQLLDSLQRQTSAVNSRVARQLVVRQLLRPFWHQAPTVQLVVRTEEGLRTHRLAFRDLRLPPNRASAFRFLPDSLVYVDAARLAYADFLRQLPALQQARGVVVDLRQRPAYGMQQALAHWATTPLHSDWTATPVVQAPDFAVVTYDSTYSITPARLPHLATRTVFLIGPDTFSYGETIVELIRHYQLGLLVGEPTGGTNGEMNFARIGPPFRLSWTGRLVRNRDGKPYQAAGIAPALAVRPTLLAIQHQQDEALQHAIAYLLAAKGEMKNANVKQ